MNHKAERLPYRDKNKFPALHDGLPYLPLRLTCQDEPLSVLGLLDTGSAVKRSAGFNLQMLYEKAKIRILN